SRSQLRATRRRPCQYPANRRARCHELKSRTRSGFGADQYSGVQAGTGRSRCCDGGGTGAPARCAHLRLRAASGARGHAPRRVCGSMRAGGADSAGDRRRPLTIDFRREIVVLSPGAKTVRPSGLFGVVDSEISFRVLPERNVLEAGTAQKPCEFPGRVLVRVFGVDPFACGEKPLERWSVDALIGKRLKMHFDATEVVPVDRNVA